MREMEHVVSFHLAYHWNDVDDDDVDGDERIAILPRQHRRTTSYDDAFPSYDMKTLNFERFKSKETKNQMGWSSAVRCLFRFVLIALHSSCYLFHFTVSCSHSQQSITLQWEKFLSAELIKLLRNRFSLWNISLTWENQSMRRKLKMRSLVATWSTFSHWRSLVFTWNRRSMRMIGASLFLFFSFRVERKTFNYELDVKQNHWISRISRKFPRQLFPLSWEIPLGTIEMILARECLRYRETFLHLRSQFLASMEVFEGTVRSEWVHSR